MPGTRKLGKATDARMAMLRQQVTDLLDLGRMETTVTRAKEIAPMAEKMITLGKAKDLASYRQALAFITREDVAKKVFDEIEVRGAQRRLHPHHPHRHPPRRRSGSRSHRARLISTAMNTQKAKAFCVFFCWGGEKREVCRTNLAPLLGELSAKLTEGSPVLINCH